MTPQVFSRRPFYHFSVDDVFESLLEVPAGYEPEMHPFFLFLKKISDRFSTCTDLYLFQKSGEKSLEGVADGLLNDLARSRCIRLGPHALDYQTPPHAQGRAEFEETCRYIYNEISRIAGNKANSELLRLHYFSECYESADYLKANGVKGLMITDKPAIAYRLDDHLKMQIQAEGYARYNGIDFIRSHLRIENLVAEQVEGYELEKLLDGIIEKHGFIIFFSHEIDLRRQEVQDKTEECMIYLKSHNVISI